jgi:hypothetical protein
MTGRLKKGSWKTLYLAYTYDADGIQELFGLYRTRFGAEARCIMERNKILNQFKEVDGHIDKTWNEVSRMSHENLKGDDPEKWNNYPFETPVIKELEVLDEF